MYKPGRTAPFIRACGSAAHACCLLGKALLRCRPSRNKARFSNHSKRAGGLTGNKKSKKNPPYCVEYIDRIQHTNNLWAGDLGPPIWAGDNTSELWWRRPTLEDSGNKASVETTQETGSGLLWKKWEQTSVETARETYKNWHRTRTRGTTQNKTTHRYKMWTCTTHGILGLDLDSFFVFFWVLHSTLSKHWMNQSHNSFTSLVNY